MEQYNKLLSDVMINGVRKGDRTGTSTVSLFGATLSHDMSMGFPLVNTKKLMYEKGFEEMRWLIRGGRSIIPLINAGISWWSDWPFRNYMQAKYPSVWDTSFVEDGTGRIKTEIHEYREEKAVFEEGLISGAINPEWGDLGPVYGHNLRRFEHGGGYTDQLVQVVDILRTDPDNRRMVMTLWHPSLVDSAALPPCHGITIILYTHEVMGERILSLHMTQRSADLFLGVPVNIAMYGYLLALLSHSTGMSSGKLSMTFVDCHLYANHMRQARTQAGRIPYRLPKLQFMCAPKEVWEYESNDTLVLGYVSHPPISAPIAV